tara:strand:- start:191292 stop:191843 length:552 start_codon:yes stop_codon:yes gene_type:complete
MNQRNAQLLNWTPNEALAEVDTVSPQTHIYGMRHFAAGVTVITTSDGEETAGLTATAVVSVTADPPRLGVFVNKDVYACDKILENGALCVNVLARDQEEVAKAFACMIKGVEGADRFGYGNWQKLVTGSPALDGALASFDCRVVDIFEESSHYAFSCEVLATRERDDGEALIYLNGAFRHIPQ